MVSEEEKCCIHIVILSLYTFIFAGYNFCRNSHELNTNHIINSTPIMLSLHICHTHIIACYNMCRNSLYILNKIIINNNLLLVKDV